MSLTPKDLVVSHQMRLVDDKVSDAHLRTAIEERARRLAEMKRLHPAAPMRRRVHVVKPKYRIQRHLLTGADQIQAPPDDTKARRWTVRNQLWLWLVLGVCIITGLAVWKFLLPDFVREGGPLVGMLIASFLFLVVIVVERTGPVVALQRSWQLMRGAWWRVTTLVTIVTIIACIPPLIVGGILGTALTLSGAAPAHTAMVLSVAGVIMNLLLAPLVPAALVAAYLDRQRARAVTA